MICLKIHATQTAVWNSTEGQSYTLSQFIWFCFEVAIKPRKPPDLGHFSKQLLSFSLHTLQTVIFRGMHG